MRRAAILIVQDDFLEAERLRVLLEQAGYTIVGIAGRTAQAMQLAAGQHPELAVIDMMLEIDVDGIRTGTELARQHGLKILVRTGFPESIIDAEGVPDLACAIARKPPHGRGDPGGGRQVSGMRLACSSIFAN